ncbi:MAG TPA: GntR family transcriptional regulator [Burkholderiales bacterium]|jgi:GntR family transcriptional regulator
MAARLVEALGAAPSGVPIYKEIRRAMLSRLEQGAWAPGMAIPSETKLKEEFGVAIGTIRKAVDELVAENILIRQQGRGTFVATHTRDRLLFHFFHVERQDGYKEYPQVRLLDFERARADGYVAEKLGLKEGERTLRFHNVLSLEGEKLMLDDITLPERLFPKLTEKRLRERPSTLYNLYQDEFGLSVVRTEQRLRAALAPRETVRALGLEQGAPVLEIHRVAFAYNNLPVELRVSHLDTAGHDYVSGTRR